MKARDGRQGGWLRLMLPPFLGLAMLAESQAGPGLSQATFTAAELNKPVATLKMPAPFGNNLVSMHKGYMMVVFASVLGSHRLEEPQADHRSGLADHRRQRLRQWRVLRLLAGPVRLYGEFRPRHARGGCARSGQPQGDQATEISCSGPGTASWRRIPRGKSIGKPGYRAPAFTRACDFPMAKPGSRRAMAEPWGRAWG